MEPPLFCVFCVFIASVEHKKNVDNLLLDSRYRQFGGGDVRDVTMISFTGRILKKTDCVIKCLAEVKR